MLAFCTGLLDQPTEFGGGGGGMSQKIFQEKTLEAVEKIGDRAKALEEAQKTFGENSKNLLAEFEKLKNSADGSAKSMEALQQKISALALKQNHSARRKTGDPIRDIVEDPEKKELINALVRKAIKAPLSESHTKALDSASTPGSTFLNDALMTDIYDTLSSFGVWSSFDVRQVNTRNNKFLVKTARPIARAFGEGITITKDSNKAGVSVQHEAQGIKVLMSVPNELMEDAEIDLSQDILTDFIEAVAFRMDWFCLQADGTNDDVNGGQTGIFIGGTDAISANGHTSIETLELEDVTGTILATDEAVMGRAACWWIHPHLLVRFLHIKDANGRPIFLTATEAPAPGALGTLLGYPVKLSSAAPSANTPGAPVAVFGDPNGMVAGLRKSFDFKTSQEASFDDDETVFRGIARFGNKIRRAEAFGVLKLAST